MVYLLIKDLMNLIFMDNIIIIITLVIFITILKRRKIVLSFVVEIFILQELTMLMDLLTYYIHMDGKSLSFLINGFMNLIRIYKGFQLCQSK